MKHFSKRLTLAVVSISILSCTQNEKVTDVPNYVEGERTTPAVLNDNIGMYDDLDQETTSEAIESNSFDAFAVEQKLAPIYFALDSSRLNKFQMKQVRTTANVIKDIPESHKVLIRGQTDRSGDDEYNWNLGLRRALAVKSALIKNGVPASKLEESSLGETYVSLEAGKVLPAKMNRKVTFRVVEKELPAILPAGQYSYQLSQ